MNRECIFCDIAAGKAPAEILHATDQLVVFPDIRPQAPVHLLIVPRRHIRSVNDIAEGDVALLGEMVAAAKLMAGRSGIAASGYKLLFNVERGGGQVIFHLHLHLIGGWRR